MTISGALIDLVPVGEENAISANVIWKRFGMWSPTSIKHNLNALAAAGLIQRKRFQRGAVEFSLYFRL